MRFTKRITMHVNPDYRVDIDFEYRDEKLLYLVSQKNVLAFSCFGPSEIAEEYFEDLFDRKPKDLFEKYPESESKDSFFLISEKEKVTFAIEKILTSEKSFINQKKPEHKEIFNGLIDLSEKLGKPLSISKLDMEAKPVSHNHYIFLADKSDLSGEPVQAEKQNCLNCSIL